MKRLSKFLLVGAALAVLALVLVPVFAQEGEGGIIIDSTFGSSGADTLNPSLCLDTTCQRLVGLLYPSLAAVDPPSATVQPGAPGGLAESWDVSEDGLVYTFHLRDDWVWSDGTPVTANDIVYAWNVITNPENESDLSFLSAENGGTIESVEAPDDHTVVVTFSVVDCTAVSTAGSIQALPSHVLPEDAVMIGSDWNTNPTVTGGVFTFASYSPEQVGLQANPDYPEEDTQLGYVSPTGWVQKLVGDQNVQVEQFLAGEISFIEGPPVGRRADIRAAAERGEAQVYEYPGNSWDYLAFNLADPTNPQDAYDEDGNPIDQGHHPLFGDVRVRRAIQMAIDVEAIIEGAVFGEGTQMASGQIPTSWGHDPDLEPVPYDPEAAAELLAEAGWRDEDGDGVLEAHGAQYAEDGTPFQFTLYTNEGNPRRAAIGQVVQDQLGQLGIQVDFQTIDFNALIDNVMLSQTFDALILGWREGFPDDPDQEQLFASTSDTVNAGSNFMSYNNPEVDRLLREALTMPGCDPEDRAPLYHEVERILQEDQPYVWLFVQDGMYAARAEVQNFDPLPAQPIWNVDAWSVISQ
jgi:peptide/nickel transport system substrate-binding protein